MSKKYTMKEDLTPENLQKLESRLQLIRSKLEETAGYKDFFSTINPETDVSIPNLRFFNQKIIEYASNSDHSKLLDSNLETYFALVYGELKSIRSFQKNPGMSDKDFCNKAYESIDHFINDLRESSRKQTLLKNTTHLSTTYPQDNNQIVSHFNKLGIRRYVINTALYTGAAAAGTATVAAVAIPTIMAVVSGVECPDLSSNNSGNNYIFINNSSLCTSTSITDTAVDKATRIKSLRPISNNYDFAFKNPSTAVKNPSFLDENSRSVAIKYGSNTGKLQSNQITKGFNDGIFKK